jgi:hypothetical protein
MAKQSFSVGQVLTAAQMTSLQQTAMLGGAASAKTANYTLVAADAGTAISMTSTSATTITVNTGLFASGDTVLITNLGSGVCTITAGTATVNTSASLALAQYESGTLYFTSSSAAIFIKGAGAAAASGGMTLLTTHTLSGATSTISGISGSYNKLYGVIYGVTNATADGSMNIRVNGSTTEHAYTRSNGTAIQTITGNLWFLMSSSVANVSRTDANNVWTFTIDNYASSANYKAISSYGTYNSGAQPAISIGGYYANTAVTSLVFANTGGNLSTGTVLLYGVK